MAREPRDAGDAANLAMRRQPRQARARGTVLCIKQAALELLAAEGLSACGTDRIAERAGLSIGSLYKYFPNREAILKALYEDASVEYAQTIGRLTLQILELPTVAGMELAMRSAVAMQRKNHLILLQLASELPQLHLEREPMAFNNLVRSNIRAYVQHRNPRLKRRERDHRSFFIERIVFSCIPGYINEPPTGMSHRQFARSLAKLVADLVDAPG